MHLGQHQGRSVPRKESHQLRTALPLSMEADGVSKLEVQSKGVVAKLAGACDINAESEYQGSTELGKAAQASMHMQEKQSDEGLEKCLGGDSAMDIDDVTHGLSRLATASRNMSHAPRSISFGRRGK